MEADVIRMNRQYRDGNMAWWRQRLKERFGVTVPEPQSGESDVGSSVKIRSPETHNHYQPSQMPTWAKLVAAGLVGTGLASGAWLLSRPDEGTPETKTATPVSSFDPGGLKVEIVKEPTNE